MHNSEGNRRGDTDEAVKLNGARLNFKSQFALEQAADENRGKEKRGFRRRF